MAAHKVNITDDEASTEDTLAAEPVLRKPYRAKVEMFKNGKVIPAGSTIMLDARTAATAAAAGDIEPEEVQE